MRYVPKTSKSRAREIAHGHYILMLVLIGGNAFYRVGDRGGPVLQCCLPSAEILVAGGFSQGYLSGQIRVENELNL